MCVCNDIILSYHALNSFAIFNDIIESYRNNAQRNPQYSHLIAINESQ